MLISNSSNSPQHCGDEKAPTQLSRRQFLLGTVGIAALLITGNVEGGTAQGLNTAPSADPNDPRGILTAIWLPGKAVNLSGYHLSWPLERLSYRNTGDAVEYSEFFGETSGITRTFRIKPRTICEFAFSIPTPAVLDGQRVKPTRCFILHTIEGARGGRLVGVHLIDGSRGLIWSAASAAVVQGGFSGNAFEEGKVTWRVEVNEHIQFGVGLIIGFVTDNQNCDVTFLAAGIDFVTV